MAVSLPSIRVLVVQLWTVDLAPLAGALEQAGIVASIVRADFEAALNAALAHEQFDVAIFDPETPSVSLETLLRCFAVNGRTVPVVVLAHPETFAADVLRAISPRQN